MQQVLLEHCRAPNPVPLPLRLPPPCARTCSASSATTSRACTSMTMSADSVLRSSLDSLPRTLFTTCSKRQGAGSANASPTGPSGAYTATQPGCKLSCRLSVLHLAGQLRDYRGERVSTSLDTATALAAPQPHPTAATLRQADSQAAARPPAHPPRLTFISSSVHCCE